MEERESLFGDRRDPFSNDSPKANSPLLVQGRGGAWRSSAAFDRDFCELEEELVGNGVEAAVGFGSDRYKGGPPYPDGVLPISFPGEGVLLGRSGGARVVFKFVRVGGVPVQ